MLVVIAVITAILIYKCRLYNYSTISFENKRKKIFFSNKLLTRARSKPSAMSNSNSKSVETPKKDHEVSTTKPTPARGYTQSNKL